MNKGEYRQMDQDELQELFLQAVRGPRKEHNTFFSSFKYVHDVLYGDPSQGVQSGLQLLNSCRSIDSEAYDEIHKGSPYYWLGIGAFRANDHELAAFFFDAAVSEDIRAGADPLDNPTPALRFIMIEGEPEEQAARSLVRMAQARVEELLGDYNSRPGAPGDHNHLSIEDLRTHFLSTAVSASGSRWRSLATAFISYSLEWDYRNMLIDIRPGPGTSEPFFLHLFKGCVLFESLLKANPTVQLPSGAHTLRYVLRHLSDQLGIPDNLQVGNTTLNQTVNELDAADRSIVTAIETAAKVRNTIGHDIGWVVALDKITYSRLFRMISASCLHSIATLYR